jgi:hypothetical protein
MTVSGRRSSGGFTGHPAVIFWLMTDYGRSGQGHLENLTILDKWLFQLSAFLEVKHPDSFEEIYNVHLKAIEEELLACWDAYQPAFEGLSFNPHEKIFVIRLRWVYRYLAQITAKGHVCDAIDFGDGTEVMG